MPRTPDRFPGERTEEGLILEENAAGDPPETGGVRYVGGQLRSRDVLGLFTVRAVYVSSFLNPTATDDSSAGFGAGMLWLNSTSGESFILRDGTPGAADWVPFTVPEFVLDRSCRSSFSVQATQSYPVADFTCFDCVNEEYSVIDGGEIVEV